MVASPGFAQWLTLADVLTSQKLTDIRKVMTLAKSVTRLLKDLHNDELVTADLDVSSVNIRDWEQVGKHFEEDSAKIQLTMRQ